MLLDRALEFVEQHMDRITRKAMKGDMVARTIIQSYTKLQRNDRCTRSRLALKQSIRSFRDSTNYEDMR